MMSGWDVGRNLGKLLETKFGVLGMQTLFCKNQGDAEDGSEDTLLLVLGKAN